MSTETQKYVVIKDTVREGQKVYGVGESIELKPSDAKHMDPAGTVLVTEAVYEKLQKSKMAEKELVEAQAAAQKAKDDEDAKARAAAKQSKKEGK